MKFNLQQLFIFYALNFFCLINVFFSPVWMSVEGSLILEGNGRIFI